jgi:acyl-CoA thioester hydrolase
VAQSTCEIRVRYGETDQMRVAYYAHYLNWFEVGRSHLLRELGMSYRRIEREAMFLPVVEAHCRYLKPARYDDLLRVTTKVSKPKGARLLFEYEVHRAEDEQLLATGSTVHVAIDDRGKPKRLPEGLARLIQ